MGFILPHILNVVLKVSNSIYPSRKDGNLRVTLQKTEGSSKGNKERAEFMKNVLFQTIFDK
jgi:hypothetical protein